MGIGGSVISCAQLDLRPRFRRADLVTRTVRRRKTPTAKSRCPADARGSEGSPIRVIRARHRASNVGQLLPQQAQTPWHDAKLVLFRNATQTGCGVGREAMVPFYCPVDQKIYIDLGFYDELRSRFGAPGDFAQAYVLTHELGHHVQHLLGIDQRVRRAQEANPDQANALSVRLELQADASPGSGRTSAARADARVGRHRSAQRRVVRRRRPAATRGNRPSECGLVHAWHFEAARDVVQTRVLVGNLKDCDTFGSAS